MSSRKTIAEHAEDVLNENGQNRLGWTTDRALLGEIRKRTGNSLCTFKSVFDALDRSPRFAKSLVAGPPTGRRHRDFRLLG